MPMSNRGDSDKRQHDTWTSLDAPNAAVAAIAKLEAIGNSAAESAARDCYLGLLDLCPGQTVLDVGAGTGLGAIEMARRVGDCGRVVALDSSAPLGAFAREAAKRSGVGDILDWQQGRAESLPFPDGTFDRAFCRWVLLHVEGAEAVEDVEHEGDDRGALAAQQVETRTGQSWSWASPQCFRHTMPSQCQGSMYEQCDP